MIEIIDFTEQDVGQLIALARRAPLRNMDEAEAAAKLLQKFAKFITEYNGIDSMNKNEGD